MRRRSHWNPMIRGHARNRTKLSTRFTRLFGYLSLAERDEQLSYVIGPRHNPVEWQDFELKWGSPFGHQDLKRRVLFGLARRFARLSWQAKAVGPFGFQSDNNATRAFEYPWAFHVLPVGPSHTVVDLGGSLGGLQFVLSKQGARVVNVDPGDNDRGRWRVDGETIATFNRAFRTSVELRKTSLAQAGFASASVDRLYCISTLEHVPEAEIASLAREIGRILTPGGYAVLTIDLFYDLAPFTSRSSNVHGRNIDVRAFVEDSGLKLHIGERSELCGYPEFDPDAIQSRAMEFVQGDIALNTTQALVLRQ